MSIPEGTRKQRRHNVTVGIHRRFSVVKDRIERMFKLLRRRYKGVSTAEISPLWGDTLGNWRECPPELEKEKKLRFLTTSFSLQEKDEFWLVFTRSYYRITLPHPSRSRRIIRNPRKDFWRRFRRHRSSPPLYRLEDHVAVNRQTSEIRRFVDVTLNEVLDDLHGVRPALDQEALAEFWGKRKPSGIHEKIHKHFHRQF